MLGWRRDSIAAILATLRGLRFRDKSLCLSGLQAIWIFPYGFYSFSYSLQFRVKRYHCYQCLVNALTMLVRPAG